MINSLYNLFAVAPKACEHSFFGLVPWYHYLKSSDFTGCNINSNFQILPGKGMPTDLPLILVAIVDDLLRVAGIVALAFIIYGAFQFVTSQGNSENAAKAQTTIINALIGLAVAITAIAFVSFLGKNI
jgi:hypothetical protein